MGMLAAAIVSPTLQAAHAADAAFRPLRLRVDAVGSFPNGSDATILKQMLFDGLYRYDDHYAPEPDLVTQPCTPSADGLQLTCQLVDTTFHDGTPFTADDVAYTFRLASGACPAWMTWCLAPGRLTHVQAIDQHTVRFTLGHPDATFITTALAFTQIASRADYEASFARFDATAAGIDPARVAELQTAIENVFDQAAPDCGGVIDAPEALLRTAGALVYDRAEFLDPVSGGFDSCGFAYHLDQQLDALHAYLGQQGIDRVAAATPLLEMARRPNGTGPWKLDQLDAATGATLVANEGYHLGAPAIERVEVVVQPDPSRTADLLRSGQLDISPALPLDRYPDVRDLPGLTVARYPDLQDVILDYGMRDGQLFADVRLRQALARCIDKARIVEAATADTGLPIESDILPASWAYQPDLRRQPRDVDAGRALIESAGWTAGPDGVYDRDGERLQASIVVRSDDPQRRRFAELLGLQAADCGMDLQPLPLDWGTQMQPMLSTYPHRLPGTDAPFDLAVVAWYLTGDPDGSALWHSRSRTSESNQDGLNRGGFSDPRVDQLLDHALATYDTRGRARDYRAIQDLFVEDQPALFGWSIATLDVRDSDLTSLDGPLAQDRPNWWWQLERLTFSG